MTHEPMTELEAQRLKHDAKELVEAGRHRIINALKHVPEDKLHWKPTDTAKSALRLAAHAAVSNLGLAGIIRGDALLSTDLQETVDIMTAQEERVKTRADAYILIDQSCRAVEEAIDGVRAEHIHEQVKSPFVTAPMVFFMKLPGRHMDNHAAQIDYVQTCYGDMHDHWE